MITINLESLSNRLMQLKAERNLLQKDIAKESNISLRSYQYYERGQREPTLSALLSLAIFFDVSLDYLVGRTDNPEINK